LVNINNASGCCFRIRCGKKTSVVGPFPRLRMGKQYDLLKSRIGSLRLGDPNKNRSPRRAEAIFFARRTNDLASVTMSAAANSAVSSVARVASRYRAIARRVRSPAA
jgi:hypothetical protein